MADSTQLNRIQNFYGGITTDDRDRAMGVGSNFEELDIFSNGDYIEPAEIFTADSVITGPVAGYTIGDMYDITSDAAMYAIGSNGASPAKAKIWRKLSSDQAVPGNWAALITSGYNFNAQSPIAWHRITVSVDTITRSGTTATLTTASGHGLTTNNVIAITVAGADQSQYNGLFKGTVTGSTTITYTISSDPGTDATSTLSDELTVSYAFLYYVTGTNQLIRAEITDSTSAGSYTEHTTDIAGTSMSLFGLGNADDRISMIRYNGDLYIGSGRYVCQIASNGVVVPNMHMVPSGYRIVSMAPYLQDLGLFCSSVALGSNFSKIFFWDLTSSSGATSITTIAMGGAQIIINFNEVIWAICVINNTMQTYRLQDKLPIPVHTLYNVASESASQAVIPDATKFVKENAFYFALYKGDKSGLYGIGQVDPGKPYALILAKRFGNAAVSSITSSGAGNLTATVTTSTEHGLSAGDDIIVTSAVNTGYNGTYRVATVPTSKTFTYTMTSNPGGDETTAPFVTTKSYANHIPYAAIVSGDNWYVSYSNYGTASLAKCEGTSRTCSSNAVYETIWIDLNSIETLKSWVGFLIGTKIVPSGCQIVVDAKVDNAASYDTNSVKSLTSSNDQIESGTTADTFWYREWTSVYGRMIRIRLRFISSTTSKATLYFLSFLSRLSNTI